MRSSRDKLVLLQNKLALLVYITGGRAAGLRFAGKP
jgi:hypothetical protein